MPWLTPDNPVSGEYVYKRLRIPKNLHLSGAIDGALLPLIYSYNWQEFGTMTADEASSIMRQYILEALQGDDWTMIGTILPYATLQAPAHTLPCDGAIYQRADYPLLYAALHSAFIIDADTFKTPDLIGKFPLGATLAPASDFPVGSSGGETEHTLTTDEMPAHNHSTNPHQHGETGATSVVINGGLEAPASAAIPTPSVTGLSGVTVNDTGGGQAHNNMPPFTAVRYCIYYE